MLYIDLSQKEIKDAMDLHYSNVKCFIRKKIGDPVVCTNVLCKLCNSQRKIVPNIPDSLKTILLDDDFLKMLICGNPNEIMEINECIWAEMLPGINYLDWEKSFNTDNNKLNLDELYYKTLIKTYFEIIHKIIDYENWFVAASPKDQYSAYHLAENLDRRSCSYCNRSYTSTMKSRNGGKLMRPQFDHWFPQSKYPLLALSFFNLIPSCYTCNSSVKRDVDLNLVDHMHPYIDVNQTSEFSFKYIYSNKLDEYRIFIHSNYSNNDKALKTLKKLKIDDMYNAHHDELKDLIKIKQAYSDTYIEKIKKFFPNNALRFDEVYRLLFGAELDTPNFHKRPLSKFKKDILIQLSILSEK